jgi:REP element-mobilizing transposase RayT
MASRSNRNIVFWCQEHVVFCPKYRRQVLVNGVERRLKQIGAEVAEKTDGILRETEVMPGHVPLLIDRRKAEFQPRKLVSQQPRRSPLNCLDHAMYSQLRSDGSLPKGTTTGCSESPRL